MSNTIYKIVQSTDSSIKLRVTSNTTTTTTSSSSNRSRRIQRVDYDHDSDVVNEQRISHLHHRLFDHISANSTAQGLFNTFIHHHRHH